MHDRPMKPVAKAIWYIEAHLNEDVGLDTIAAAAGVSRFHLSRAFPLVTGLALIRYVRARRLSEAARRLAGDPKNILAIALDTGYGSHEAFTRAFRDHFGVTPESVRTHGLASMHLQDAFRIDDLDTLNLAPPSLVQHPSMRIAGLCARYSVEDLSGIPGQWQKFTPYILQSSGPEPRQTTWGVCFNTNDTGLDYVAGIEAKTGDSIAKGLTTLALKAQLYARFAHTGHVTQIRRMWQSAFEDWLPQSGYDAIPEPNLERYGANFDPLTGEGDLEIWIPVHLKSGSPA